MCDNLADALAGSERIQPELTEVKGAHEAPFHLVCGAHRGADSLGKTFSPSLEEAREVLTRLAENLQYASEPCGKKDKNCLLNRHKSALRKSGKTG